VVLGADGTITYTPNTDFNGIDTFTYTVTDTYGESAPATVTITVTSVNDAPVFAGETPITSGTGLVWLGGAPNVDPAATGQPMTITFEAATDVDGDTLSYAWELSLVEDFSSVLTTKETKDLTLAIGTGELLGLLEPEGLAPGAQLAAYQRLTVSDPAGKSDVANAQAITFARGTFVATEEEGELPSEFYLEGNYPNPFNPRTTIEFGLPQTAHVTLTVYDMTGRVVRRLFDETRAAGRYQEQVDFSDLASGVYLYRLVTPEKAFTRIIHLVK